MMLTLARLATALFIVFVWWCLLGPKTREEAARYVDMLVVS
jgi:hypothetical protein